MSLFDWGLVLGYTVVVLWIGHRVRRRVSNAGGFLLGNRKLGTPMMVASTFAGGINANNPISVASNTYSNGLSGMWLTLAFVLATPVFWMWPPVLRRLRIVTLVDFFRMRYGRGMEWIKLIITLVVAPFTFGVGMKAAAMLIVAVASGPDGKEVIGIHTAIAMVAVPTLVYTLMGGVIAAYAIDMFQSVLIVFLSFVLLPFMVWQIGGMAEVVERVDAHNPQAWNLIGGASGVPAVWLVWFAVSLFFSGPAVYGAGSGAAKNEMAARWALIGNLGKRLCTVGWGLTGLFAVAVFGAPAVSAIKPDDVFASAVVHSLPSGLRGVMVASMLAAAMSSLAGMMLTFSGSVVNNLYKDYLVRDATPDHYLTMARVFSVLPIGMGWVVAGSGLGLIHLVVITEQVNSTLGITMLAALMWRRTTGIAAVLATSAMVPLFYFGNISAGRWPEWYRWLIDLVIDLYQWVGISPQVNLGNLPALRPESLLQLTTPIYLTAGLVILIVVSLFTRQHDERAVAEFYARADTPLGEEQRLRDLGFQADTIEEMNHQTVNAAPEDRDRSRRLLLLDFLTWPWLVLTRRAKLSDYWIDFAGIAGSVAFIAVFLWSIASLGSFFR